MNNTQPDFFANWTKEQLITECARLNTVLQECNAVLESVKQ